MSDTNYEVKHVDYNTLRDEIAYRLAQGSENELRNLWNGYCEKNGYDDNRVESVDWEDITAKIGAEETIRQVIKNKIQEEDAFYSVDGYGKLNIFPSITSKESPMDLKEVADKIIDKLEQKYESNFEYDDKCKYLVYDVKVNGEPQKRILETTDNDPLRFMGASMKEVVGDIGEDLVYDEFLIDVFDKLEEVKPEQTNTKRMKP